MNERVKEIRKALQLTQQEFAARLKVRQQTISMIEAGNNYPSEQLIGGICREFRVNEEWLRTGAGEMFIPSPETVVDKLAEDYRLCPEAKAMVAQFITLDPEAQLAVFKYMCAVVDEIREQADRDDQLRAELERQLSKEKTAAAKSEA